MNHELSWKSKPKKACLTGWLTTSRNIAFTHNLFLSMERFLLKQERKNSFMFDSILAQGVTLSALTITSTVALLVGVMVAGVHAKTTHYSKNFAITLVTLPILVQFVIMMTSGNLGTGVAIMGTFSLIRFRSMPGTSRELISVFAAMTMGLIIGTGYVFVALFAACFVSIVLLLLHHLALFDPSNSSQYLTISMPEDLEHETVLQPVFEQYQVKATLESIRLKNMGSIFELNYHLELPKQMDRRAFINDLRIRNRNLAIILGTNPNKGGL
ncbi:DUF4956 domain-containing protein [Streptococcus sp. sy010]|nr:DUF4956 domain-containing protein [Streptococcus sp. sy010]